MQHREPAPQSPPWPRIPRLDRTPGRLPHLVATARQTGTTAQTALAALDAAAQLRKATGRLAHLYGAEPVFSVNRHRVHLVTRPQEDQPADGSEFLAGDVALLVDGDLHPDVDPDDLSMVLTASGIHGTTGVWISAPVPPLDTAEGL